MTVGELAKKMNTTVRTLQYYDREGLFSPSAESEGGRRLYTNKDLVRLHQIQALKYLGFSLEDIGKRLASLETPAEVAGALGEQAEAVREQIAHLSNVVQALEALKEETLQMQAVDFKKYADIVVNLQMKNEFYRMIKHFDENTLDHLRSHFDKESGEAMLHTLHHLFDKAAELQKSETPPASEEGIQLAQEWWSMVMEFTGGDMSLLPKLMELADKDTLGEAWGERWTLVEGYITKALEAYFMSSGVNPFESES